MKKFLLTLTSLSLCLSLVACGGDNSASSTPASTQEIAPAQSNDTPAPEGMTGERGEGMTGERGEDMMADRGEAMGSGDQMMAMLPEGTQLPEGFADMTTEEKQAALSDLGIDMEAMMSEMMANRGEGPEGMADMERPEGMEGMERPEGMEGGAGQMMPMLPEGVELPENFADMTEEEKQAVLAELGIDLEAMMADRGERTEGMDMSERGERPAQ